MSDDSPSQASAFRRFFSNPVVGVIGSLASIVGVLLAIYFFAEGRRYRELVFCEHPLKAVVVSSGQAANLRIMAGDKEIKGDVTVSQVALWNQGTESIRRENILEPIMIRTEPGVPVLEATIRKESRKLVGISL